MTDSDQMDMANLGRQVRALREKRGLSLRALAERVDVTASFLSQLERGLCSPSLASLRQIAMQLDVPVFQLLVEYEIDRPVVRADERVTITPLDAPVTYELLSSGSARSIEMFSLRVTERNVNIVRRCEPATEECVHVVSGTMEIDIGSGRQTLEAGDSVTYQSLALAYLASAGVDDLVAIVTVTPPSF